jgi:iron-sulfur cluster insertion protein
MITITEKAISKVKELSESEGVGHFCIRSKIQGGGCNGYTTDLVFDDQISDMDEVFEQDGVKIIIDQMSFQYLDGTSIDWIDNQFNSGFSFNNPNVKGSCGCGNSQSF